MNKETTENTDKFFRPADLSAYSWDKRLMVLAISHAAHWLIGLMAKTIRIETEGEHHLNSIKERGLQPIYALWHDRIFLGTYYLRGRRIVAMTSQSFDGEYIARLIQLQGNGAARGSSTRGGVKGLVEMIRLAKHGIAMCFIVDGPKGPPYVAKEGAVLLAKKSGFPVLPMSVEVKDFWTTNSWDKLQIARPFTKGKVIFAEPIYVAVDADGAEIEARQKELQSALDRLVDEGKKWRTGEK